MSYSFNKITVRPQLPDSLKKLEEMSYNLWWSWNTEFLRLFKKIDKDLWEGCGKNPIKFLRQVSQEAIEEAAADPNFVREYEKLASDFENYMASKNTWFARNYPDNKDDLIAYFSAEYGLDETMAIYSGGLGILSGDHLKSASDMGIPLVGVGLLYKKGYFHQKIDGNGKQETLYKDVDIDSLPITPIKDEWGDDLLIELKFPASKKLYLKVWEVNVGRTKLYLMDSDIEKNPKELRDTTTYLYGGDQEMRIKQEIVLGMAGVSLLHELKIEPTVYHMNEGHSAFLTLELIKNYMKHKQVSFEIAKAIVTSQTVFTTHTPVPAGNDIFPIELVEKYFKGYWDRLGISKEEFMKLGMTPNGTDKDGFNMGILALKIAGKKNGVSKLHGEVSRELFGEIWPEVPAKESPIDYVTNGVHTCTWVAPTVKDLYNKYLRPYWQDQITMSSTWEDINDIPDEELWEVHQERKRKLLDIVKQSTTERLRRYNYSYEEIEKIVGDLDPNVLTIGFARRFATYKRATLIFRDLERITKIFSEKNLPIRIIFAGKAHPNDPEGASLIKYIHELSLKPQFKGKLFILENYNIGMSRYLVSGVDVWLNNPRRPLEASGTSGQKAAVNGVINFSVLDGWWAEGYNQENGWAIGKNDRYQSYDAQDDEDANSIYDTLENKIIPMYYDTNEKGYSDKWVKYMKNSIISNAGEYSTARMLEDYLKKMYIPLCNLTKKYYQEIDSVADFVEWKNHVKEQFDSIKLYQDDENFNNITVDAGKEVETVLYVELQNELVDIKNINAQVYMGKISDNGIMEDTEIVDMTYAGCDKNKHKFTANVKMKSGGDYGYTFRIVPKHEMLLDNMNLNIIKYV